MGEKKKKHEAPWVEVERLRATVLEKGFVERAEGRMVEMLHRAGAAKEAYRKAPSEETKALLEEARVAFQEARGVHTELKTTYAKAEEACRLAEEATQELWEAEAERWVAAEKAWKKCKAVQERYNESLKGGRDGKEKG